MSIEDGSSSHTPEDDLPEAEVAANETYAARKLGADGNPLIRPAEQGAILPAADPLASPALFELKPGEVREFSDEESRHYYSQLHHEWDQAVEKSGYSQSSKARLGAFEISGQVTDDENLASIEAGDFMRMLIKLRARPEDLEHTYLTSFGKEDAKRIEELLEKRMMNTLPLRTYDAEGRLQSPLRVVRGVDGKWNESVMGGGFKVPGDDEWLQGWQEYLDDKYREDQEAHVPDQSVSAPEPDASTNPSIPPALNQESSTSHNPPESPDKRERFYQQRIEEIIQGQQHQLGDPDFLRSERVEAGYGDSLSGEQIRELNSQLLARMIVNASLGNKRNVYADLLARFSEDDQQLLRTNTTAEAESTRGWINLPDIPPETRRTVRALNNLLDLTNPIGIERNNADPDLVAARENFSRVVNSDNQEMFPEYYIYDGEFLPEDPLVSKYFQKLELSEMADSIYSMGRLLRSLEESDSKKASGFKEVWESKLKELASRVLDQDLLKDKETYDEVLRQQTASIQERRSRDGRPEENDPFHPRILEEESFYAISGKVAELIVTARISPDDPRINHYKDVLGDRAWKDVVENIPWKLNSIHNDDDSFAEAWADYDPEKEVSKRDIQPTPEAPVDAGQAEAPERPATSEVIGWLRDAIKDAKEDDKFTPEAAMQMLGYIRFIEENGDAGPKILALLKGIGAHDRAKGWGLCKMVEEEIGETLSNKDLPETEKTEIISDFAKIGLLLGMDEADERQKRIFDILKSRYLKENE